jgi:hypothetical protein
MENFENFILLVYYKFQFNIFKLYFLPKKSIFLRNIKIRLIF